MRVASVSAFTLTSKDRGSHDQISFGVGVIARRCSHWPSRRAAAGSTPRDALAAGAYTRPLLSSTCQFLSQNIPLNAPLYNLGPLAHTLNNPQMHPCPTESAYIEP